MDWDGNESDDSYGDWDIHSNDSDLPTQIQLNRVREPEALDLFVSAVTRELPFANALALYAADALIDHEDPGRSALYQLLAARRRSMLATVLDCLCSNEVVKRVVTCYACAYGDLDIVRDMPDLLDYRSAPAVSCHYGYDPARATGRRGALRDELVATVCAGDEPDATVCGDGEPAMLCDSRRRGRHTGKQSPLFVALYHRNFDIAEHLVGRYKIGSDPEAMLAACEFGDVPAIDWLADRLGEAPTFECLFAACVSERRAAIDRLCGGGLGIDDLAPTLDRREWMEMLSPRAGPESAGRGPASSAGRGPASSADRPEYLVRALKIKLWDVRAIGIARLFGTCELSDLWTLKWFLDMEPGEFDIEFSSFYLIRLIFKHARRFDLGDAKRAVDPFRDWAAAAICRLCSNSYLARAREVLDDYGKEWLDELTMSSGRDAAQADVRASVRSRDNSTELCEQPRLETSDPPANATT